MGLVKKIAGKVGKTAAKVVTKKIAKNFDTKKIVDQATDIVISKAVNATISEKNLPQKFESKSEKVGLVKKTTNFLKQAGKEFSTSDVIDIAGIATGTSAILGITTFAGKTALDVKETTDILSEELEFLRTEGKITQDMLDAILCENKNKLAEACNEVLEAIKRGEEVKYLSKEEVDSALSLRKAITKAVVHKILG